MGGDQALNWIEKVDEPLQTPARRLRRYLCWSLGAVAIGLVVGAAGTAFGLTLGWVTATRERLPWLLWLLPFAGLLIVFLYEKLLPGDRGTNLVITTLHGEDELPPRMAPMIFVTTALTHLFGGSAGREGAALQLGGSIANWLGALVRLDERRRRILVLCGMSAGFSAVFGTPVASAIFAIEVASVGVMQYSALIPCAVSSLTASAVARRLGLLPESFKIGSAPDFGPVSAVKIFVVALLCAAASELFCLLLHSGGRLYKRLLPNPYLRVFAGGALICLLTLAVQTRDYLGAGTPIIAEAIAGRALPWAFALKMLFTVVTLGAGYKGGELVPTLFVGATLGCTLGTLLHISPALCAAVGMVSLFCGVTNCPITALILGIELFGSTPAGYLLLAVAISYVFSGDNGLYEAQTLVYERDRVRFSHPQVHGREDK